MTNYIEKTKHYSTKAEYLTQGQLEFIPQDAKLIEPFVGAGDLINLFPNHSWEKYDIEAKEGAVKQDTLLNPPEYKGKWVITNPPYLAKNKCKDKTLFNKYGLDDWYKCAIASALECEGGIFIIPLNFFTDERTYDLRNTFFNTFEIISVNVFNEQVFDNTTYTTCSFVFRKGKTERIHFNLFPQNIKVVLTDLKPDIKTTDYTFTRLLKDRKTEGYITNIKLYAIDNRNDKIRLEYNEELFYGKGTDRTYATMVSNKPLTIDQQKELVSRFNKALGNLRNEYKDLCLTNYRDFGRKRIGFNMAYDLLSCVCKGL